MTQSFRSARLIVSYKCTKDCAGCCNKNWKYAPQTLITDIEQLQNYDQIIITGGEPLLFLDKLEPLLASIYHKGLTEECIVYTAVPNYMDFLQVMNLAQSWIITLHDDSDVRRFNQFMKVWWEIHDEPLVAMREFRLRLNVFHKDITVPIVDTTGFKVKNVEWIPDYPLSPNEELFQLVPLW